MKILISALVLTFSVSALAQKAPLAISGVREGGGGVQPVFSIPAEFKCNFIYDQQIGSDYIKLIATKTFTTEAGFEKVTEVKLTDLNWQAEIDFEKVFEKQGNKAIIKGGLVNFRLFKSPLNVQTIYLMTRTPTVVPEGKVGDLVYSSDMDFADMPGEKGKIEGQAQFVLYQNAGKSYVIGLKAKCEVKSLE